MEPGSVDVGAITSAPQLELIESHVADALAKGARLAAGGSQLEGPGRFFQPTLLLDADHTMACMTDETFGPTLPVMRVADADEAVARVNESRYGLGAAVFAPDSESGEAIARRLRVGAVCVNDAAINYFALEAPMGGIKQSGIGVRHGADGVRKFTHAADDPDHAALVPAARAAHVSVLAAQDAIARARAAACLRASRLTRFIAC